MATPIIMPRQGQSVESCILTEWKVNLGDEVAEGDVLAVIETDKASFDLESTAAGKVLALFWEADDDVPVLANVAVVGQDGEDVEEFRPEGQGGASFRSRCTFGSTKCFTCSSSAICPGSFFGSSGSHYQYLRGELWSESPGQKIGD